MSDRFTATASCEHCTWKAKHTDDSAVEVALFLRQRLLAHAHDKHPDLIAGKDPVVAVDDTIAAEVEKQK